MRTSPARAVFLAVSLAGCGRQSSTGGDPPADPSPKDVAATVAAAIPTVVTVTWTTDAPTTGHVEFGLAGAFDRSTPVRPGAAATTEHSAVLVGLPASTEVSYRVVSEGVPSDAATATTGALPAEVPSPSVEGGATDVFALAPSIADDATRIVLFDPEGRATWAYTDDSELSVFRARVRKDGGGIVYTAAVGAGGPSPDSAVIRVSWDGALVERTVVPDLAHDFVELDDGTIVSLAYETRDDVLGNKLVAVAPDGTWTDLWSTWDCFDPVANPGDDPQQGWTHANALDYDPVDDAFLVGMRNLATIAKVDHATGACAWGFGGSGGTVAVTGPAFLHEHQFEHLKPAAGAGAGAMLVFDNDGAPGNESRVIEYTFDEAAGTASLLRTYRADPPLYSFILGDMHRHDNGDTTIAWAVPGLVDRMTTDGARTWRMSLDNGDLLGFVHWVSDPYTVE